jgi:hypothetical protein
MIQFNLTLISKARHLQTKMRFNMITRIRLKILISSRIYLKFRKIMLLNLGLNRKIYKKSMSFRKNMSNSPTKLRIHKKSTQTDKENIFKILLL